ncbi:hypothetical protein KOI35_23020 [Actinoplanes bogorensis]|uniref:Uncharacterized protein n=1 Tax=Paractinoplanes bogorensis TaxID=1610840 RepID=A0ABS5YSG4_9ACTN|nr:hypothetical protein [Actinoplanes bogorensis]MBU2666380.1 hypothetical protein [Actinoplanes bogorensis]
MLISGGVAFGLVAGWWLLTGGRPSAGVVAAVAVLTTGVPALVAGIGVAPQIAAGLVAGMAVHAIFRWGVRRSVERETPG